MDNTSQEYERLSNQIPKGWSRESVKGAMIKGYSCFRVHMLRPSPDCWTLELLIEAKAEQKPEVLDPLLILKQCDYIHGKCTEIMGQTISREIKTKMEQFA